MGRLFGTDGVRGVAGIDLTAQLAIDLAVAAVPVLVSAAARSHDAVRPVAVIGRDSRASGDLLEGALVGRPPPLAPPPPPDPRPPAPRPSPACRRAPVGEP